MEIHGGIPPEYFLGSLLLRLLRLSVSLETDKRSDPRIKKRMQEGASPSCMKYEMGR
jgi:hypothetical protein